MRRSTLLLFSLLVSVPPGLGCADALPVMRPSPPPKLPPFRLGPGDVVEVVVWDNPALSRTVPVRPDGQISLPLVDDVEAAGMQPTELRDVLAQHFAQFVSRPVVSVIVQQIHSNKALVVGEVAKPGRFELDGPATVLDLIARAGGFTEWADKSNVVIIRQDGSGVKTFRVSGDALSGLDAGVWVANGDVVMVR